MLAKARLMKNTQEQSSTQNEPVGKVDIVV